MEAIGRAEFLGRASVGVANGISAAIRVGVISIKVGRRQKKLHAFDVGAGAARAVVHVAAADKFGSRRNTDLISGAVITDADAHGMGAVAVVVGGTEEIET